MMNSSARTLPAGADVPFNKIGEAMARGTCQRAAPRRCGRWSRRSWPSGRSIGLARRAEALQSLGDAGTVRGILISEGDNPAPPARVAGNTVALHGLKPQFFNNAVAALRLVEPADARLVARGPSGHAGRTGRAGGSHGARRRRARADLGARRRPVRRQRVQRPALGAADAWRALMAHFFDIPEVQAAAPRFSRLTIAASRSHVGRVVCGLAPVVHLSFPRGSPWSPRGRAATPIEEIRLGITRRSWCIRLRGSRTCLETEVSVRGHRSASRLVPLADQSLTGLMTEELRIRARESAFESALAHLCGSATPDVRR